MEVTRIACVGAIVHDDLGRLLMVRRGHPPGEGRWSIPGGHVEPGESLVEAVVREVLEETALPVDVGALAGSVAIPGPDGQVYDVQDFHARPRSGCDTTQVRAGDDADEVGWITTEQLQELDCVDGLLDSLRRWQVVPQRR